MPNNTQKIVIEHSQSACALCHGLMLDLGRQTQLSLVLLILLVSTVVIVFLFLSGFPLFSLFSSVSTFSLTNGIKCLFHLRGHLICDYLPKNLW